MQKYIFPFTSTAATSEEKNKRTKFNLTSRKGLWQWSSFVLFIQDRVQTASCEFKQELTEANLENIQNVNSRDCMSKTVTISVWLHLFEECLAFALRQLRRFSQRVFPSWWHLQPCLQVFLLMLKLIELSRRRTPTRNLHLLKNMTLTLNSKVVF